MILGGGSNVLLTKDYEGVVLKNEITGIDIIKSDDQHAIIEVGAGEVWHEFVLWSIKENLAGIENLSLIPGSVGASPMQNIGAYGVEIKDVFHSLKALNIDTLDIEEFDKESCHFGYRESIFKNTHKGKYVILSVQYQLKKQAIVNTSYGAINQELAEKGIENPQISDVCAAVISIRQSKLPDPKKIGNAGSFFKNPIVDVTIAKK